MTNGINSIDLQEKPNLEIRYHTRKVLSDNKLPERVRYNLRFFEFITYMLLIWLLIGIPYIAWRSIEDENFSLLGLIFAILPVYLVTGPIALFLFGFSYPYHSGYVSIGKDELHFRRGVAFQAIYQRMIHLEFKNIKTIIFQDSNFEIAFEHQNGMYAHLVTGGMAKSDLDALKNRLLKIPGIKFEQV